MSYEIVPYAPEHEAAVVDLERILWRGDAAENVAHLRWKYQAGPLHGHNRLFVALAAAEVVGVRGLVASCWEVAENGRGERCAVTFLAVSAADLVIAPEHRNTGLYRRLTEHALAEAGRGGYAVAFNFSAGRLNRVASLGAGWRQAFAIPEHVRGARTGFIRGVARVLGRGARRWARPDACRVLASRRRVNARDGRAGSIAIGEAPRAGEMADLVARAPWDGRIRQRRDEAYFGWRFDNPKSCTRFVTCRDAGRLRGYLALQARSHRPGHVTVVDHEAESAEVRAAMLRAAVRWAKDLEIVTWSVARAGDNGELGRLEFASQQVTGARGDGPCVLIRALDSPALAALERETGRELSRSEDWDLRPAYSDAF